MIQVKHKGRVDIKRRESIQIFIDKESAIEYISSRLKEVGIVIHRYDAVQSNSSYLKFDYGVAQTLRISDHRGKAYASYKYNLDLNGFGKEKRICNGHPKYTYGMDSIQRLVNDIIDNRQSLIRKHGEGIYNRKVKSAKKESVETKNRGFWRGAYRQ